MGLQQCCQTTFIRILIYSAGIWNASLISYRSPLRHTAHAPHTHPSSWHISHSHDRAALVDPAAVAQLRAARATSSSAAARGHCCSRRVVREARRLAGRFGRHGRSGVRRRRRAHAKAPPLQRVDALPPRCRAITHTTTAAAAAAAALPALHRARGRRTHSSARSSRACRPYPSWRSSSC